MRGADRSVLAGLAVVGLVAAFWFLALSPQREEAAELEQRVEQLQASVAEQEQLAAAAEEAREGFDRNYQSLVVLGKAVPQDEDTASLFVQLDEIAKKSEVGFEAIRLEAGSGDAPAPAPAAEETTVDGAQSGDGDADAPPSPPAVPTEAAVAGLPLGATVGPAGLPVMPYKLDLTGSFFELADFLEGLDSLVRPRGNRPRVRGRLLTVDGFSLTADEEAGFPLLSADVAVTSFVTPAEQGLTAGAAPTGPPPAVPASEGSPPGP